MLFVHPTRIAGALLALGLAACGGRTDADDFSPLPSDTGSSGGSRTSGGAATGGTNAVGGITGTGSAAAGGNAPICGPGMFHPADSTEGYCKIASNCVSGQYVAAEPTPTTDRLCASCETGFTTANNSKTCNPWSTCEFDEEVSEWGTAQRDTLCQTNRDLASLIRVDGSASQLTMSSPGGVLVAYAPAPGAMELGLDNFKSPGLEKAISSALQVPPLSDPPSFVLPSSGGVVYLVGSRNGGQEPLFWAIDGSSLATLWSSPNSVTGDLRGATVEQDGALAALLRPYGSDEAVLVRWSQEGVPSEMPLEKFTSRNWRLFGSDSAGNLYFSDDVLRTVFIRNAAGDALDMKSFGSEILEADHAALGPSGAYYVAGPTFSGTYQIARYWVTGSVTKIAEWNPAPTINAMFTVGENLVIAGCTTGPWTQPVTGGQDALVAEFPAAGPARVVWQFGGGSGECVQAATVGDDGQFTVITDTSEGRYLIQLN